MHVRLDGGMDRDAVDFDPDTGIGHRTRINSFT